MNLEDYEGVNTYQLSKGWQCHSTQTYTHWVTVLQFTKKLSDSHSFVRIDVLPLQLPEICQNLEIPVMMVGLSMTFS